MAAISLGISRKCSGQIGATIFARHHGDQKRAILAERVAVLIGFETKGGRQYSIVNAPTGIRQAAGLRAEVGPWREAAAQH